MFFSIYFTTSTVTVPDKIVNDMSAEITEIDNYQDGDGLKSQSFAGNRFGQVIVAEGENDEQVEHSEDVKPEKKTFVFLLGMIDALKNSFCKNEESNINKKDDDDFGINILTQGYKVRKNVI